MNDLHEEQRNDAPAVSDGRSLAVFGLLIAILALGASLRLVGMNWDEGRMLHPDERFLSWVTADIHSVSSLREYFDTLNSPLNPNNVGHGFYVYGDFPVILTRYIAEQANLTNLWEMYQVGRPLSTAADLLTVVFLFLIGRRLFDHRIGLLAAALYAVTAFPLQQSHFYTVDTITTLFVTASMYFAVRALTEHRWLDYGLFGIMLGLAMSSKVSIFPLALLLILALAIRVWRETGHLATSPEEVDTIPALWSRLKSWSAVRAAVGLAIAGLITILVFRVGQPYAFLPPDSDLPLDTAQLEPSMQAVSRILNPLGFRPNPHWLAQMSEVRQQVSGQADIPPNHQWGKRLPLIFPWVNMVRIGMGWPLGIWCWLAFFWAVWELVRGHKGAIRLLLLVAWIALYFSWQGIGWVKTMRYFLPVYPFLILLGAWAVFTMWDRIHGLLANRGAPRWHPAARVSAALGVIVFLCAFLWGYAVTRIYTRPVTRVAATEWVIENVPSDVTLEFVPANDHPGTFQLGLDNNWPPRLPEEQVSPTEPPAYFTYLEGGKSSPFQFRIPYSATLTSIRLNHVVDPENRGGFKQLRIAVSTAPDDSGIIAESTIIEPFTVQDDPRGEAYSIDVSPITLNAGQTYWLLLEPDPSGPLVLAGSAITTEGDWDDPVPLSLAPYNIWDAQFHPYEFHMAWEDSPDKRARMQWILDHTDYLTISSNRFYASLSRNPERFPLSIAYYQALFSGQLGFELVADFTSRPTLGPIEFRDDTAEEAWTVYDHPRVFVFQKTTEYDPAKVAAVLNAVDLDNITRAIAGDARGRPVSLRPPELNAAAKGAQQAYLIDLANRTASDSETGLYRRVQPLAVIVWWLLIGLMGWAIFPALFVLFPGLPDRGFGVSRIFGMLFASWFAWLLASLRIMPWTQVSALVAVLALVVLGVAAASRNRTAIAQWLRERSSHVLFIEITLLAMYVFFLLVRLGNPDLWHPSFGGEKPMDLAYFNAVLKSTHFPPYDPWFAGGTINYYYFGFVIVGLPIKLLGIPPTLGYNMILPTLFALTGVAAFSAAYNLLAPRLNIDNPADTEPPDTGREPGLWHVLRQWPRVTTVEVMDAAGRSLRVRGNGRAYVAGIGALLLAAVLGNLDQIRTILWGFAELGAGQPAWTISLLPNLSDMVRGMVMVLAENQQPPIGLGDWYWNATRVIPVPIVNGIPTEIGPITEFPYFTFLYADLHAHMLAFPITLLSLNWSIAQIRAASVPSQARIRQVVWWAGNLVAGGLIVGALRPSNTWDWPTYLALAAGSLLLAHIARRADRAAYPALATGAAVAGLFGGAMYLLNSQSGQINPEAGSGVLRLAGAATAIGFLIGYWFGLMVTRIYDRGKVDPEQQHGALYSWITLIQAGVQIALLVALNVLLYQPYIQSYRLGYTSAIPWAGSRTPLWAYLDILGLFLFLIVSWFALETWRWWRAGQEGRGRARLLPVLMIAAGIMAVAALAAARGIPVSLVAMPLIVWALALFLRTDQPVEKRSGFLAVIIGLSLTLVVEVVVLQGDIGRMNTVFKFYLQVWVLLAITAGAALGWVWPSVQRSPILIRAPWMIVLVLLVFLAALYPFLATRAKIADRWNPAAPHSLEGMVFMPYVQRFENNVGFSLEPDYQALRWLQDNVEGTPVVLEAQTTEYLWGSRVSIYTGFPTVIGWNWHQRQQRGWMADEVWRRVSEVAEAYNTTDINRTLAILRQYEVDLIMVGELEQAYYQPIGLAKFDRMVEEGYLRLIYEREGTKIYEVIQDRVATS